MIFVDIRSRRTIIWSLHAVGRSPAKLFPHRHPLNSKEAQQGYDIAVSTDSEDQQWTNDWEPEEKAVRVIPIVACAK